MIDNRAQHQPIANPPAHEQLDAAEQERICGSTIAVVIADDWNTTPLTVTYDDPDRTPDVCDGRNGNPDADAVELARPLQLWESKPIIAHAVKLASTSGFASVHVLLCNPGEHEAAARKAIGDAATIHVVSGSELAAARDKLNLFELFCVNSAALLAAQDLLKADSAATGVMFIGCESPRITPWHTAQLCLRQSQKPSCDVVFSWIYWLRRLPVLISRGFFDTAREQGLFEPRTGSIYRPLPALDAEEVVFGEEKLAVNESSAKERDEFLAAKPMSALESVRLAHRIADAKDAEKAASLVEGLSPQDRELLEIAQHVVANISKNHTSKDEKNIAWASAWGKRNMRDFAIFDEPQIGRASCRERV